MQHLYYKRYYFYLGLALMWLMPSVAMATVEQMYFVGSVAPLGSISLPGQATAGVYLRWDIIEGDLPADLKEIVLKRDGVEIARLNPNGVLPAAAIDAFYAGADQQRRFIELKRWLDEEAASAGITPTGTLGERIRARLLNPNENYWATLASRIDFNVARARMRAYLDTAATPAGLHIYNLFAVSTAIPAVLKQIGSVTVDTTAFTPFPAAQNFVQVRTGRCDAPERFKDHGSVALNWANAGASPNDMFIASLLVSGYDIYRTTSNVTSVAAKDIRLLAAGLTHDAQGNITIPGLEKVNDQPLVISGSAASETGKKGWNPPFSQFMETASDLAAKGLKPGDKRAYYLVPRTFDGNYGKTVGLLVTVPDLIAPPAPWNVHTVTNSAALLADAFSLEWPQVNVKNYQEEHKHGRTYCNLSTALRDGQLRYVPEGQSCAGHPGIIVDLKPQDFLIYRFDNIKIASEFSDSDGDGFSDQSERITVSVIPPLTKPGTACDATVTPAAPPAVNYLTATLSASTAVTRSNGRDVIIFKDTVPASNKSIVYWYRIATRDLQGNISKLSKPIRGFFPDRKFPLRDPGLSIGKSGTTCSYSTTLVPVIDVGGFQVPFAQDLTQGNDAKSFRMRCDNVKGVNLATQTLPITTLLNGTFGVQRLAAKQCSSFQRQCSSGVVAGGANQLVYEYLDGNGSILSSISSTLTAPFPCPAFIGSKLTKQCKTSTVVTTTPGEVVSLVDWPLINYTGLGCVKVFRDVGGKSYPLKTLCPPITWPVHLNLPAMGGEKVCISASVQNDSGELSPKHYYPCVMVMPPGPPSPPQPIDFTFQTGTSFGDISWLPPEQPVAGTIVEWFWKGADNTGSPTKFSKFFEHSASTKATGTLFRQVDLTPEQSGGGWEEQWCFRARSVGQSLPGHDEGALSGWSAEKCGLRIPAGETLPTFLPWPKVPVPEKLGDLMVKYLPADGVPVIRLSDSPISFSTSAVRGCAVALPVCVAGTVAGGKIPCLAATRKTSVACPDVCATITSSLAGKLGFVVYRQRSKLDPTTDPTAAPTEFIQVSPLIDRAHCDQVRVNIGNGPLDVGVLDDPFIQMLKHDPLDLVWGGLRTSFVDRAPFQSGHWYRYQLVYFDANGEITGHRDSPWFKAR